MEPTTEEMLATGRFLAGRLKPATGFDLQVLPRQEPAAPGNICLVLVANDPDLGEEGYHLEITADILTLRANQPAGLFWGVQTIRQLLPARIESDSRQPGRWYIAGGTIRDYPRFAWRGAMLDVARHFFGVPEVQRFIDRMAYYKLNRLHLHLTDDQGWRIEIKSWPRLAALGGSTSVGGDGGGYFTQADYAWIVEYAHSRHITVVPEIDTPGHTSAALAACPELTCDGVAPELYRGTEVGFSSLCIQKEVTYRLVEQVIAEVARLTPGPYIHIGGDEALATPLADYQTFIERAQSIVRAHGKRVIGWEEIAQAKLLDTTVAQHWNSNLACQAVEQGARIIMSPATRVYLDMKYDPETELGLAWAGYTGIEQAYNWDPAEQLAGITESHVLGVEAPLWTETIQTAADLDFMAFPRLAGVAEIGWSPRAARNWEAYRRRLAAHGPRLGALGVNFYPSPEIDWESG